MNKAFVLIPIAAALMAAAFGWVEYGKKTNSVSEPENIRVSNTLRPINAGVFVDQRFEMAIDSQSVKLDGKPIAGVVNHHTLASDLIAGFFSTLKEARPEVKRFVIISPDHYFSGRGFVSTHSRPYAFKNRTIESDADAIDDLVVKKIAVAEQGMMFEQEHGIGALMPFLAREFPEAKVIPIAIRNTADRDSITALGQALAPLMNEETFLIISADMSHYLTEQSALANDQRTLELLKQNDFKTLSGLNDDYTDSGFSFMSLEQLFSASKIQVSFSQIGHAISSNYIADKSNTTSYITGMWVTSPAGQ